MRTQCVILALLLTTLTACATTSSLPHTTGARAITQTALPGYVRGAKDHRAAKVIVFVHGVIGDGRTTWTNSRTGAYFPQLIAADDTFANVDIWVHDFDSPKVHRSYTIDELADHLRKYLNNDNVIANHDEVIFIAHSMGGLVTRAFLLKYRHEIPPDRVRMLYFYSTPTTGSDLANLARLVSNNPQFGDMRKMTTNDPNVLGIWEAQWSSSGYAQNTRSYCAYELLPTHGTVIVQRESARHLCNTRPDPIARNHIDIAKPANNTDDESYVAFREAYRDTYERNPENGTPVWNLRQHDQALLQARNATQQPFCENGCWTSGLTIAPGDTVELALLYANDALMTARDALVRVEIPPTPLLFLGTLTATLSATNTQAAHGQIGILPLAPVLLVPTAVWQENPDTGERQPVLFGQGPALVATTGIRLGDIGIAAPPARLIVQLRCEPAMIVEKGGEEHSDAPALDMLRNGVPEDDLAGLLTPAWPGSIANELLFENKWISDVKDVDDDAGVSALLSHFNNTNALQRDVRARVILTTVENATTIEATLRDINGVFRTETARVHLRPGTHGPLRFLGAFPAPKTTLHMLHLIGRAMRDSRTVSEDDEIAPLARVGDEILLGDVAPQSAVTAELLFATRATELRGPEESANRTTLNAGADVPFLQIADECHGGEWRTSLTSVHSGDLLSFLMYFRNNGHAVARDVRLNLTFVPHANGLTAVGTMRATNADIVVGSVEITLPERTRLYHGTTEIFRVIPNTGRRIDVHDDIIIGHLEPDERGWVKIVYLTPRVADDSCVTGTAIPAHSVTFTIAMDNPRAAAARDATLRVHHDYARSEIRSTLTINTAAGDVVERVYRSAAYDGPVKLRFRDAQVYTATEGQHFDARKASETPVTLGDVPPKGALFVRITYDVVRVRSTCTPNRNDRDGDFNATTPCQL